ncbi:outer membrane protein assembly factor BamE [Phytobacter diazotrophicus]|uniref:outer membrane protein assembly factor BamE domain-containing protein n=1 Tax=Phytobacter diazotrophicus TaxID=395631 RepID=UPI002FF615A6
MRRMTALSLLTVSLMLTGCVSSGNQALKTETQESVKAKLIKGKTTKEDVQANFGAPYSRATQDDGNEVWSYVMHNSQMNATSFIPVVGLFTGGSDNQSKTLQITFKNNTVDKWSFSSGDNAVKTGIIR